MLMIAVLSVLFMLGLGFVAAFHALADLEGRHHASGNFDSVSPAPSLQIY